MPAVIDHAAADRPGIARALFAALVGIVTQAIFDPESWPAERQTEAIEAAIAHHTGPHAREKE